MERAEIERLGDALYLAMCDRRMVAPLTDSHPNLTIEQAYEISLRFLANRLNAGEKTITIGPKGRVMEFACCP